VILVPVSDCIISYARRPQEVTMRRVQVFDVNETLLDLAAMDPQFERIFGTPPRADPGSAR
jgi:hypothetical protein